MTPRLAADAAATSGKLASRLVRPFPGTRLPAQQPHPLDSEFITAARRCAASMLLSASLICGQAVPPGRAVAAMVDSTQIAAPAPSTSLLVAIAPLAPPPLASSATAGVAVAADDMLHFFQHGVEAMESKVHNLQVVHALERLEGMSLNEVVDLELLKAAIHPSDASYGMEYDYEETGSEPSRRLDAALDAVAQWHLRDVVDVAQLANALQDVPYTDPLDTRALQRDATRIRRMVHWETVAASVRPQELRLALTGLNSNRSSPFSELDLRAAVAALRMDAVRKVLLPAKAEHEQTHNLESSGMWTWESM